MGKRLVAQPVQRDLDLEGVEFVRLLEQKIGRISQRRQENRVARLGV